MHKRTTPQVFARAKELRRELTPLERKLWGRRRAHPMKGVHFRAQHAIGDHVVNFCAGRKKLIIDLDGSQHLKPTEYDARRTEFRQSEGY